MKFTIGFSPCPNDTFIFDALINKKIDTENYIFEPVLEDVQTLNQWAIDSKLNISKISYGVLPLVLANYVVLNSGGALGKGVGPLLIAASPVANVGAYMQHCTVAIPGVNTTAHMLFSYAFPRAQHKQFIVFNQVENTVLSGAADAGVIIHENRFTYQDRGLHKLMDLGEYWEQKTQAPIPLGGIVVQRKYPPEVQQKLQRLIAKSVEYSFAQYPQISAYISSHSQEMSEDVMRKHIDLYVNNFTLDLGSEGQMAVYKLLEIYAQINQTAATTTNIFV